MSNNVISRPLKNDEKEAERRDIHLFIPIAGLIIGCILWPIGARYTIDGVIWIINNVLAFLRMPTEIPTPLPWQVYIGLVWLPFVCSRVEWRWPIEIDKKSGQIDFAPVDAIFVWLCVAGADFLTTYFGVRNPAPDAWELTAEIAGSLAVSGILSAVLTFGPEWLIRASWRRLRG